MYEKHNPPRWPDSNVHSSASRLASQEQQEEEEMQEEINALVKEAETTHRWHRTRAAAGRRGGRTEEFQLCAVWSVQYMDYP